MIPLLLLLADAAPPAPRIDNATDHALAWKGALLLRQQERRLFLRLDDDPAARMAAEALQSVTRRLAALRLSPAATKARLDALEKEQEEAQAELSRLSAAFREAREKEERPTPERLAKALPPDVALVDYHFHIRGCTAFIHRNGKTAARAPLGAADEIDKEVKAWRSELLKGKPGDPSRLHGLVWKPLEKHLGGAKVVLIAPDGLLATIPFAALPGRKKGTYLIEDHAIGIVPVPATLPQLMKPPAGKPSLLTVGDIDYGDPGKKKRPWVALPATKDELSSAATAFGKRGPVVSLTGAKATKAAVRAALASSRFAHIATHGFYMPEKGAKDADGWHPLLRSGLVFANANKGAKGGEDGILTASEVAELDLSTLELAILAADETALGPVAGGEGMLSTARAFHVAGCRSVVASLFPSDDAATRVLMGRFHHHLWVKKLPKAEALRQAQLDILRDPAVVKKGAKSAPPAWWAAWQLSGDWR